MSRVRSCCGTCHMAFLFMPLPRAATSTNCSTNVLLNTSLHATSCTATTLWSSSHISAPLPSPFTATLTNWGLQPFSYLASHLKTLAQNYYARNLLLAKNNTDNTQHTSPKVLAPNRGCSTVRRRSKGTNESLGGHFFWSPIMMHLSQLLRYYQANSPQDFPCEDFNTFSCKSLILKLWWRFYCRKQFLATNSIGNTYRTSPKVSAPYSRCPATQEQLWTN